MSFIADKQTLDDLNLTGKYKPNSIFYLFNKVLTAGGERLLEKLFREPLTDFVAINRRSNLFRYFQHKGLVFPFTREQVQLTEDYLAGSGPGSKLFAALSISWKKLLGTVLQDEAYGLMLAGLESSIAVLQGCQALLHQLGDHPQPELLEGLNKVLKDPRLSCLAGETSTDKLSLSKVIDYGHLLRSTLQSGMEQLLDDLYWLDVSIAIGKAAKANNLSYATALSKESNVFQAENLRHPALAGAVGNPLTLRGDGNVVFLTGANMAGKSTFMKSFGISVYLGHMGFPVAADNMKFSVKDGLYSSINVPDNINLGYSHFYAEVLRVKNAAEAVARGKDMIVIFDELFKGTNVKDAYDATLAVTDAFSEYENCFFIISTHIIEVGEALRERRRNIQFAYLPTIMEGAIPRYTYRLEEGITTDRQGMTIILNEGILDILQEVKE